MRKLTFRSLLIGSAALALAACDNNVGDETMPTPPSGDTAQEDAEPISIIRADVAVEPDPLALEPLQLRISFAESGSELNDAALQELQTLLESDQIEAGGPITLRGHTDSSGRDEVNLRTSQERAEAVRDWLVENGVAADRMTVIALGEQNPAEPNALPDGTPNEKGRATNRRVDIHVALPPGLEAAKEEEAQSFIERVSAED